MAVLPSYRNQSIDLLCKSIDWFLYEGITGIEWVNFKGMTVIFEGFLRALTVINSSQTVQSYRSENFYLNYKVTGNILCKIDGNYKSLISNDASIFGFTLVSILMLWFNKCTNDWVYIMIIWNKFLGLL